MPNIKYLLKDESVYLDKGNLEEEKELPMSEFEIIDWLTVVKINTQWPENPN